MCEMHNDLTAALVYNCYSSDSISWPIRYQNHRDGPPIQGEAVCQPDAYIFRKSNVQGYRRTLDHQANVYYMVAFVKVVTLAVSGRRVI